MRVATVVSLAAALCVAAGAPAASPPDVVPVTKVSFPPPLARVGAGGAGRLELVSMARRDPAALFPDSAYAVERDSLPHAIRGATFSTAFRQPGTTFAVYGTGILAALGPRGSLKYAFDLRSFGYPPRWLVPKAYGPQEITWARQLGRTLVVQTNHLGYASDSGGRNGYLTGVDLDTGRVAWRSPALVANARTFVVTQGLIVSGYGFTAEHDWLYLLDPRTGRVRDRLALPSAPERITLRGGRIVVRCYDAWVTARLAPS